MATRIPLPGQPGDALLKGLDTGSTMFSRMIQPILEREKLAQADQHFQDQMALNRQRESRLAQFGGLSPSGDVANALVIEQLRQQYGEDDPRFKQAQQALQNQQDARRALIDYRGSLQQTEPFRALSPLGKLIAEGKGQGPLQLGDVMGEGGEGQQGGGVSPDVAEAYQREIAKKTSTTQAQNKFLSAQNIDKAFDMLDKDALVQYSGIAGIGKWLKDQSMSTAGKTPENLKQFQTAVSTASALADQLRQFWGDSIQPQAMDRIRHLTKPSSWYKNPDVALAQLNQLQKLLQSETSTYKTAATSPVQFGAGTLDFKNGKFVTTDAPVQGQQPQQGAQSAPANQEEKATVLLRNSKTGATERVTVEEARRRGVKNV